VSSLPCICWKSSYKEYQRSRAGFSGPATEPGRCWAAPPAVNRGVAPVGRRQATSARFGLACHRGRRSTSGSRRLTREHSAATWPPPGATASGAVEWKTRSHRLKARITLPATLYNGYCGLDINAYAPPVRISRLAARYNATQNPGCCGRPSSAWPSAWADLATRKIAAVEAQDSAWCAGARLR
jgi:hypothetical protein